MAAGRARALSSAATAPPRGVRIFQTSSPKDLESAAAQIAAVKPSLIVMIGGDGTVTATLSALVHAYAGRTLPRLCLLPGGTVNTIARSIGVRENASRALRRLWNSVTLDRHPPAAGYMKRLARVARFSSTSCTLLTASPSHQARGRPQCLSDSDWTRQFCNAESFATAGGVAMFLHMKSHAFVMQACSQAFS